MGKGMERKTAAGLLVRRVGTCESRIEGAAREVLRRASPEGRERANESGSSYG